MTSGDIPRLPEREDLPEEFAAIGLPDENNELRIIINISEARFLDAYRWLRPHVFLPVVFAPFVNWAREHPLPAAGSAAVAAAAASVAIVLPITATEPSPPSPPAAIERIERVVTEPAAPPVTVTTTATPTRAGSTSRPAQSPDEPIRREPAPAARPTRSAKKPVSHRSRKPPDTRATDERSPRPTAQPGPVANDAPSITPAAQATSPVAAPETPQDSADPSPTAEPSPTLTPAPPDEPALRDCLLRVDLDPLLDLCVLT